MVSGLAIYNLNLRECDLLLILDSAWQLIQENWLRGLWYFPHRVFIWNLLAFLRAWLWHSNTSSLRECHQSKWAMKAWGNTCSFRASPHSLRTSWLAHRVSQERPKVQLKLVGGVLVSIADRED